MMETTAMMVRTPMMMPNNVRNVLNLFDQRDPMAMDTDSEKLTLAIVLSNILLYMIRYREAKVLFSSFFLTTFRREHTMRQGK